MSEELQSLKRRTADSKFTVPNGNRKAKDNSIDKLKISASYLNQFKSSTSSIDSQRESSHYPSENCSNDNSNLHKDTIKLIRSIASKAIESRLK
jgi:hypothetical protein